MNSVSLFSPTATSLIFPLSFISRRIFSTRRANFQMGRENLSLIDKTKHANVRLCNVSGYKTDLLEIHAQDPSFHVLFIPGNPGVISFYTDFLESLYDLLGGNASITAIGHISHSEKDWELGRLFSLQEQIDHKTSFIEHEFQDVEVPIILVGHSIGAYISLEIFRRSQEKVIYCIGLYPFLAVNTVSSTQSVIRRLAASQILCAALSSIGGLLGKMPAQMSGVVVKKFIGKSWSSSAVVSLCTCVLQYHTIRNMLFMAMTEFEKLSEKPDWAFMREKKSQIAFLFGVDDHWGPLHLYEEIRKQVPNARVAVEREGHTHAFSCSEAGSLWVAQHVASLIKNHISNSNS
ncbi:alpha/beta-hydrolase superfamily protein [Forsythia ovata]|uniref:Alpha/beta-hydrolase superfamily protein n=1 Tax=Forsythia ovata TaxID=205694 RepID=A0ABD1WXD9_9LAMI